MLDFFGRVFTNPDSVVPEDMLKPELQGMSTLMELRTSSRDTESPTIILMTVRLKMQFLHSGAAAHYVTGHEGKTAADAEIHDLFTPAQVRELAWYQERLVAKQENDVSYLAQQAEYIDVFCQGNPSWRGGATRLGQAFGRSATATRTGKGWWLS